MNLFDSKNKKIGWIEISLKKYGGIIYNEEARETLRKNFNVELILREAKIFEKIRYLKIPESLLLLTRIKGEKDLWIRDFYSTVTLNKRKTKGKNLAIIHHIDSLVFPLFFRPFFPLLKVFFYRNLKKADFIITVSEYWKNHFSKKGYKNVYKIYNGFNLSDFNISDEEILDFKQRYNLQDKPIIYLGNCQKAKGVAESYKALKELDIFLVTSGRRQVKIPAINLNLEYKDYLKLLKASSIVVTMSKFKEGWCRTAHEAMLCKTPVIGSGLGGMKELLEGGKQIICKDTKQLKERAEFLLKNLEERNTMGENGYSFAENFTKERFKKSWLDLINKILD